MRLLLIEDDPTLGAGLCAFLQGEGHVVDWCDRLADTRALMSEPYDVLLVDWQLPDGSGVDWISQLRARGLGTPAIVLTARDLLHDRITGLDSGADDFIVKPFAPEELAARMRAVTRRLAGGASARKRFGAVELDLNGHQAWLAGAVVDLTAREWRIVEALVLRAGRIVERATLESLVLGSDCDLNSNALEVHVSNIRRKLGRDFIDTVRGMGYRVPQ